VNLNRTGPIVIIGSVLLTILAVLSWFLVLSPRMGQAGEIKPQTESVESQTDRLNAEFAKLSALQRDLPALIAEFDEVKATFPTTAELPSLLDQIRAAAAQTGVTVQALETSPPELVAPPADEGTAPAAEGETAAAPAETAAAPADGSVGVPAAGIANGNLATMPMSITVSGNYDQLKAFLSASELLPRAWLINSVQAQGGQEGGAITLTAAGSMFVLDTTGIAVPPAAAKGDKA